MIKTVAIKDILKGSPADKCKKIKKDYTLLKINGNEIMDVLDYSFYAENKNPVLLLQNPLGKKIKVKVKKEESEDLGLVFETYLMDKQHSCKNKCIFCFIDQLPKGLRKSLYFKDDDSRLSFLFGNYITLTNITEHEVERIIKMHISPINISVHTTNKELRCKIMNNRFAGDALKHLYRFNEAGIKINCQLVLMPGINDGQELKKSLTDILALENVQSVSAVPVGLTKYRQGLYPLRPFTSAEAKEVISIIESFNTEPRRAFAGDEFYIKAELPFPKAEFYGDFLQLENGIGMSSLFEDETEKALSMAEELKKPCKKSAATGVAAFPQIKGIVDKAKAKWHNLDCKVFEIKNDFFGHNITVSGLITGKDIINQLKGKDLGEILILPDNMLRREKDIFLDDTTVEQLETELNVKIKFVSLDGFEFIDALLL